MTNEDAKRTLQDMWECLFNEMTRHTFEDLEEHGMLANYSKAFEMALAALSTDGEYIKKEDAITAFELSQHKGIGDGRPSFYTLIKQAQSYALPDSTENKGEWRLGGYDDMYYVCSKCGFKASEYYAKPKFNFCPNCRADMRPKQHKTESEE